MSNQPNPLELRVADHPIEKIFLKRWSPRAMSGAAVEENAVNSLFEAARWAPSTYNEQEWRFLYAHHETEHWPAFFDLLMEANQTWCEKAGVLVLVLSRTTFTGNGKPNPVHEFDAGLAVQNLLLQAATQGLVSHAMAGFDRAQSKRVLGIPDGFEPHCMIALGHPGDISTLPENYQALEVPSGRKPIGKIAAAGTFCFEE